MGEFAGTEAFLLAALAEGGAHHANARSHALALLDCYRATAQRTRFEDFSIDYVHQFGESAPEWGATHSTVQDSATACGGPTDRPAPLGDQWSCPAVLDGIAIGDLGLFLAQSQAAWRLNWSDMQSTTADAVEVLEQVISAWCVHPVRLEFVGADQLLGVLNGQITAADGLSTQQPWQLLFKLLQVMRLQAEFETLSMRYCVVFERSPPPWANPACTVERILAHPTDPRLAAASSLLPAASMVNVAAPSACLRGEITDDASVALSGFNLEAGQQEPLHIDCADLVRVDFSAASSILNWVTAQQGRGVEIHFIDVHRLIATLFEVVGIVEYARINVRR
ncbi:MAG: STAS domain-containing protein [Pseudomonadota bacterium]